MHAGNLVVLVFDAKGEHQRPPGGAGRPRDVAAWPPPLQGRSGSSLEVGSGCVAPTAIVRGRPAWLWLGSGSHCIDLLLSRPTMLLKLSWALVLWFVTDFDLNLTWFRPFGLSS